MASPQQHGVINDFKNFIAFPPYEYSSISLKRTEQGTPR